MQSDPRTLCVVVEVRLSELRKGYPQVASVPQPIPTQPRRKSATFFSPLFLLNCRVIGQSSTHSYPNPADTAGREFRAAHEGKLLSGAVPALAGSKQAHRLANGLIRSLPSSAPSTSPPTHTQRYPLPEATMKFLAALTGLLATASAFVSACLKLHQTFPREEERAPNLTTCTRGSRCPLPPWSAAAVAP